jgi:DnaK suppressor protein
MRTSKNREACLEELRTALLAERARIASGRLTQLRVLTTPENTAVEDRVPLVHEQFVVISATARSRRKLALIEAALDRLARGEFGICAECEEEIPLKRLQAIPWATHCVPCQELLESEGYGEESALAAIA